MLKSFKVKNLFKKADAFFKDNKYDEALNYYNEILLLDDSNLKALYKKAYILYKLKLFDESIQTLNTILDSKKCIEALLLIGRIYLLKNNYEEGMYYYKLSLNEDIFDSSKFIEEIFYFGDINLKFTCKEYKRLHCIAIALNDLYIEKYDEDSSKFWKSYKLYELGYYEKALVVANKLPESFLDDPEFNYLKSSILLNLSKYEDALIYINNGLMNDLNNSDFLQIQKKGECLYHLGNFNEATKCFNKVIELKEFSSPFIFLSKISMKNEKYEDALKNIDKAIDLTIKCLNELKKNYSTVFVDRDFCEVFYYKSLILFKLERYSEALEICNCLIKKVPDCPEVIELKNKIEN
ncbi:MAG: tetratricopeptide repeat protein [Methanobacteriaceae archaeon]|nr:tetratricopeptide repeat protein [Methanobacteriaceae archaeon]